MKNIIQFVLSFFFRIPEIDSDIFKNDRKGIDWLKEHLESTNKKILIIAGEGAFLLHDQELTKQFEKKIDEKKKITVICGPYIEKNNKTESNPLIDFVDERSKNYRLYHIAKIENTPRFHFCIASNDIIIEKPHPPKHTSEDLDYLSINNSLLWKLRLELYVEKLLKNAKRIENGDDILYIKNFLRDHEELPEEIYTD